MIANVTASHERHLVKDRIDEYGNYILSQEDLDAVYNIINLCDKNGWKPILITTPFLKEYTDLAWTESVDYMDDFYGIIDEIVEKTGIEYYDYSLDERFSENYDLFMNGDHLNKDGAKIFTDILLEEVLGY